MPPLNNSATPRNEREALASLWNTTFSHQAAQRTPSHQPHRGAGPINADRVHQAVSAAHREGRAVGYRAGYKAGTRWGYLPGFGWGLLVGSGITALAVWLGAASVLR